MTPEGRAVRAMVLSGGSVYAAYEVGVLKALLRGESPATDYVPMNPGVFVGTSGGAVNAAMMTSRPGQDILSTLDFLESVWVDQFAADPATCREGAIRIRGDFSTYSDPRCFAANPVLPLYRIAEDTSFLVRDFLGKAAKALSPPPRTLGRRALEFADATALISNEVFVRVMYRTIDLQGIRDSDRLLRVAATNWRTGELRIFSNEDMSEQIGHAAILASTAFPGIPPVSIEGEPYVDGGYLLNTPLQSAIDAGGDELHVVFMDPDIKNISVNKFDNVFDVIDKLYQITQANLFKRDIKLAGDVNEALDYLEGAGLSAPQLRGILDVLAIVRWPKALTETPLRRLVIHLYHPREDLGGTLGLVNFDRGHILRLIAKGYADAVAHDCRASGCIVPGRAAGGRESPTSGPSSHAGVGGGSR